MTPSSAAPTTLAGVLAIDDDVVLLESVSALLPDDERAAPARHMADVLTAVQLYLSTNGIGQVLDVNWVADELHCVEGWWTALGAHRAAELAAAVGSLFPGGRVPRAEAERCDRFMALMENGQYGRPLDDPWYGVGIFQRLDLEFADAVPDVARAMRAFLRAHASDVVGALVRVALSADGFVPPARPTEWRAYADNGLDGTGRIEAWRARFRQNAPSGAREPVQHPAADERVLTFFREITGLREHDWSRIASRRLAGAPARHELEIFFASVRSATPRTLTDAGMQRMRDAGAEDEHVRASLVTRALPRIGLVNGQRAPLELLAIRAAIQGADAARWHDDLVATEEGRRVLHAMLSPFEGYITDPGQTGR